MSVPNLPTRDWDDTADRRRKPRITCALPALVRRVAGDGSHIRASAHVLNLSADGLYLTLEHAVACGERWLVLVWFDAHPEQTQSQALAVRGTVRRVDGTPSGTFGVAIHFERYRFV